MKYNVLVFPCEGNNNELHDALSYCFNINVYGASSVARHGQYIYKNYDCSLPYITDPRFIGVLNQYLEKNKIDVIIPNHDAIALYLAENAEKIHAKIVQSDIYTNRICRSKIKTHELFEDCSFVPKRFKELHEIILPAFVKPDVGEGGLGAFVASKESDLQNINCNNYLVTEFLPGKEYTVDCFTDGNGKLVFVSPRSRKRIMAGISVAGTTEKVTPEIKNIAITINDRLKFIGLWYFQLRTDKNGVLKLMEVSVRCAGAMCLTRARGINFPLLTIYVTMGLDVSVDANSYSVDMDRSLITRYNLHINYDFVYIDFDDTITLRGEVNLLAMFFLYQCLNKGKKVFLLTRHPENIKESLFKYAIAENLFKEIIHIKDGTSKADYILQKSSIFIDNMNKERVDVKKKCGIPVFDADAFEFLLDWRV